VSDDDDATSDDDDASGDDDDASGDDDDSTDADGMIAIPAGTVEMGCQEDLLPSAWTCDDEELPPRTVTISAFRIDAFEVTNADFVTFLNDHGNDCGEAPCMGGFSEPEVFEQAGTWMVREGDETLPAVELTWHGASAYCDWAGKRLPTEAEWERAARGDTVERYAWGAADPTCKHLIWSGGCGEGRPWAVDDGYRSAGRSPFGVWDMGGNVWEYVQDRYASDYYEWGPTEDPQGPVTGDDRVVRGGGWESNDVAIQVWTRWGRYDNLGNDSVGFRCAAAPS